MRMYCELREAKPFTDGRNDLEETRRELAFRPLTEPDLEYMMRWLTDERVLEKLPAHEAFEGTMADCLLMEYRYELK